MINQYMNYSPERSVIGMACAMSGSEDTSALIVIVSKIPRY
jgi:hypothetical protein